MIAAYRGNEPSVLAGEVVPQTEKHKQDEALYAAQLEEVLRGNDPNNSTFAQSAAEQWIQSLVVL